MGFTKKSGHDNRVGRYRAKPKGGLDLDDDESTMVQEQIARLRYFSANVDLDNKTVLDWGCGTGFNCEYMRKKFGVKRALGVDISLPTVEFARQSYPECEFEVGDVCDSSLNFGYEQWDYVICCEVFEHVHDVGALLNGIIKHLRPGGYAFLSTPNLPVFSLGHEPSPVNQTHIQEYCIEDFSSHLENWFAEVKISGQRFRTEEMEDRRISKLRRSINDYKILHELYWNDAIRRAWKVLRLEPLLRWYEGVENYRYSDFSFVTPPDNESIWLCAIVRK